jgi:hypothetical protein
MRNEDDALRRVLEPHAFNGDEALAAITALVASHARPPDLAKAIGAILRRTYGGSIAIDTAVAVLRSRRRKRIQLSTSKDVAPTGTDAGSETTKS